MAGDTVAKVPKPQLRGLLYNNIKKNLAVAFVLSIVGGIAWKVGVMDVRKKKYAEFYKTYNAEESLERMRKAGVLSSAAP